MTPCRASVFSERLDDKYFAVLRTDFGGVARVTSYSERLPKGSTIADAEAAALAELPPDGKALWTATRDTCAPMELRSAALATALVGARWSSSRS